MPFEAQAPVAVNVNTGNGLQTLSQIMGLKQQQLQIAQQQIGLQQQQQQLSSQTSQATVAAINAKQQQALSQINWKQFVQPDGSYDVQGATQAALQAAPNIGPDFVNRLETMAQGGADAKKAFFNLNQDYQQSVRAAFGTWGAPDSKGTPSDLAAQLQAIEEDAPADTQKNIDQIITHTMGAITGPDPITGQPRSLQQQKAMALAYSRAGLTPNEVSGTGGIATPGAGTANTGTQILSTTTNRMTGVTKASGTAPIANLSDQINLPNGQVAVLNRATGQYGVVAGTGAGGASAPKASQQAGATAAPGKSAGPQRIGYLNGAQLTSDNDPQKPGPNDPSWRQQTYGNVVVTAQKSVLAAQEQDANYGTNMQTANMIRSLSNGVNTGPGTTGWTRAIGLISSRFGGSSGVSDTQTLASFLDLQSTRLRESMGLPETNAGLATSQEMGTSIESQRSAIQAKTNYYQALTQLYHEYRTGLDAAGNGGVNPSPSSVSQFKRAFAANADPVGVEIRLATQRGDTKGAQKLLDTLSPQQRQLVAQHVHNLALIAQGQLPQ